MRSSAARLPRLFFAIWPPPGRAAALHAWAEAVQPACGGRVTRADAIHLTLSFLGEIPEAAIGGAIQAARCLRCLVHAVPMEQAVYWRHNRIIWVGPRQAPAPLQCLAEDLKSALENAGFKLEDRPFQAHVTLVRKAREPRELPALPPLDWPVNDFLLVRSRPAAAGSAYEMLQRFPLD